MAIILQGAVLREPDLSRCTPPAMAYHPAMGAKGLRDGLIEDFSIVLKRDAIRALRGDVFAGSKPAASLWLGLVACIAGGLGGLVVSGALWNSLIYPPAWILATAGIALVVRRLTMRFAGSAIGFLAGWCIFWGILAGSVAMWAGQLGSSGWAYGIVAGFGFLIGITEGQLDHAEIEDHDIWFMTGTILAPAGIGLAVWLHRHGVLGSGGFLTAALTGMIAATVFLAPVMALYMRKWNNKRGLVRLASLYLHHDDFVADAIPLLDAAIRLDPSDAALYDRRALAHALAGDPASADDDWRQHLTLQNRSRAPDIARGWLHLRRDRPDLAAEAFDKAISGKSSPAWALIGQGIASLRLGLSRHALEVLGRLPDDEQDARSLTYMAQARLMLGDLPAAIELATDAIDELDSTFGLSWLVRGEAEAELGNVDGAILAFNRALEMDDELGIGDRAMEGLEKVDGPVFEEDELEDYERNLRGS